MLNNPQSLANTFHHAKIDSLREKWSDLTPEEQFNIFKKLPRLDAEELFLNLPSTDQTKILSELTWPERRSWLRLLAPDDTADVIQQFPEKDRIQLLSLLDPDSCQDVIALLAYAEDDAGGLMNPRFVRLRPDVTVDVAIRYLRMQARAHVETIHYAYVIDANVKLVGTVSFRDLLLAPTDTLVSSVMEKDVITASENMDQEELSHLFRKHGLTAIPVVDTDRHMKGIVTVDDIVHVVQEEATEDIQKLGGMEALDAPYFNIALTKLIKKRVGWLLILFLGEMFTATAMGHYGKEIERAIVLALFIPLIISSGGNSGSQASTLIIRAMALGEVKLRDCVKVLFREISSGLALGTILGTVGFILILLWPTREHMFGEHYVRVGLTVAFSLVGIVLWGTLTGAMLPFLFRRIGVDPATASAPFVATLVDVTGIVIYFTMASLILGGTLL